MSAPFLSSLLVEVRSGYWGIDPDFADTNARVVRNGDIQERGIRWEKLPLRGFSNEEFSRAAIRADDLVITTSGECGFIAHVESEPRQPTVASNFVRLLRLDLGRVFPRYMYYFGKTQDFRSALAPFIRGTTLKNLAFSAAAERVRVPLPSLAEQRRIAEILDKADALRVKRNEAISKLDSLLQSIYFEMFGDPVTNPMGWPVTALSSYGEISTGNTPSRAEKENYGSGLEWVKSDNLNHEGDYVTEAEERLSSVGEKKARAVPPGSVLVTCIAGSFNCIGNLAIADRRVAFNQQINAVVPNESPVEFVYSLLKAGKPLIQAASTNSMKGMVSKSKFCGIKVPTPPLQLQQEFARWFRAIGEAKKRMHQAARRQDELFSGLQQRAFSGGL